MKRLLLAVTLLAGTVHAAEVHKGSPFVEDLTVSAENAQGTIIGNGIPIDPWSYEMQQPPNPAQLVPDAGEGIADPMPPDETTSGMPITDVELEPDEACPVLADCSGPPVLDPMDWQTVYRLEYGIQVEDLAAADWPTTTLGKTYEVLNTLRVMMQSIHAAVKRDVGVELKIRHVHLMHGLNTVESKQASAPTEQKWKTQLSMHSPVKFVLRIQYGSGGKAQQLGHCPYSRIMVARAGYWWLFDWNTSTEDQRNQQVHTVAQELMHTVLPQFEHTQCYRLEDGVTPLERCLEQGCWWEDGWTPALCPPLHELSFMSYCAHCYNYSNLPDPHYPRPRIGPWRGPMAHIARGKLLSYVGTPCVTEVTTDTAPVAWLDTDGDEQIDKWDNCPTVANNDQRDDDSDGKGNACGCAVVPGAGGAWALLGPLAVLAVGRIRRYK